MYSLKKKVYNNDKQQQQNKTKLHIVLEKKKTL